MVAVNFFFLYKSQNILGLADMYFCNHIYVKDSLSRQMTSRQQEPGAEMGFLDHLGELRRRLLYSAYGILAGCIISGYYGREIIEVLFLQPARDAGIDLQNIEPFGQTLLFFKVVLIAGVIIASPWIFYQVWRFVEPGLYRTERSWALKIALATTFFFLAGVFFGYRYLIPQMLKYVSDFTIGDIKNNIYIGNHISFMINMLLAGGFIFELPVVAGVLARFGIVTATTMRRFRRHSIVVILILAAMITPSPDPMSQLMLAVPLWVLYEFSVIVAKVLEPKTVE